MKKFLTRLLIIIAITLVADRALSYVIRFFYNTTTTTDEYKINSVTSRMTDPVIFMGSSRCHHHYIPSIIGDSLQTGVYNAGLWGMRNIYFQYALLSNILERYTPETICLEIHPADYLKTPFSDIGTVGILSPFIHYSHDCDELLKKAGVYYKSEVSHLYRYNSQFANILAGNLSERSFAADKGYKQLNGQLDISYGAPKPEKFPFAVDQEKVQYLQAFIDKCKKKNINLIFLFSPMYATEKTNLFDIPSHIASKNNIPFLNHYYLEGITGHLQYFHDFGHLNDAGAKLYSSIIGSELKRYIKRK
ncbi:hypothetical protein HDC92_004056 [Pedobacter sp. AK017]|uniref:hypothetical protein n=1 Tax=Pedobacter sp. AK017 TaxID=2723073 RepID=UPI00160A46BE|nr:hypothetical protein [Pedobacter sp. AK017]MBB5440355.1 hypothetical protein [Pedobacter sp. AK017]